MYVLMKISKSCMSAARRNLNMYVRVLQKLKRLGCCTGSVPVLPWFRCNWNL